jgi:hypothetical protein
LSLRRPRKGLSAVFGFIIIFMLLMAGLEAFSAIIGTQGSIAAAQNQAGQIEASRKLEHLTVSLNGTALQILNDGLIPSTLAYLYQASVTDSVDSRMGETLSPGATTSVPILASMQRYAVVTSLGNVFISTDPASSGSGVLVTFDASGATSSFGSSPILTVDGTGYNYSQLPKSFEWAQGSVHSYSYTASLASGSGSRIGWGYSRGLTSARQGSLTVEQAGSVVSYYSLQYLLTVLGGGGVQFIGSPTGDGWYDAGASAQVSSDYSWAANLNESRQNLVSYSLDGSTPAGVQRSAGGVYTSGSIAMNSPHTLDLISTTQYHLSLSESWTLSQGASISVAWSYTGQTSTGQGLQNPGFESGSLSPWANDASVGVESGVVHSGGYAAYISPASCYGRQCQNCCVGGLYQSVAIPSGATLTSYSVSAWYYIPTTNTGTAAISVAGIECAGEPGTSGTTVGAWVQLTYSWSGSCTNPGGLEFYLTVLDHSSGDKVYVDDAVLSYTYVGTSSGTTSAAVTATAAGGTVTYSSPFSYTFPQGSYGRSLAVTFPSGETFKSLLVGAGPTSVPPSGYTQSGNSVTISDSGIGANGESFTLQTTSTGSYEVSQAGSQTADGWYDAGTTASLIATASVPFSFVSWAGASNISSPSQPSTTITMSSYCSVVGEFQVSQ